MESQVNWAEQWALFAENYHEGRAHIDLSRFGVQKKLLLYPGPGFGDLSHPTTALMLDMMAPYVAGASVIDIGTGSGILALAALLMGAHTAVGIDIDEEAVSHARKNNRLNGLKARFAKKLSSQQNKKAIFSETNSKIFLMNMIFSEQKQIDIAALNCRGALWITSGILETQKERYLEQAIAWGWQPLACYQKGEWLGWVFTSLPLG